MSTLQPIIDRIAKLRRLATSDNANEAAAAAAAADKLMQAHGIAEAQLEAAGEAPKEAPVESRSEPVASWTGAHAPSWATVLAAGLVSHYDCSCFIERFQRHEGDGRYTRGKRIVTFGRPSDIEAVRYMFAWLNLEIERLAKKNAGNGRAWINSFKVGAVSGCLRAMRDAKAAARAEAKATPTAPAATSAALALIDNRLAEATALRTKLHGKLRSGSARSASNNDGYHAGREAGSKLGAQHKSLQGASGRALKAGGV